MWRVLLNVLFTSVISHVVARLGGATREQAWTATLAATIANVAGLLSAPRSQNGGSRDQAGHHR